LVDLKDIVEKKKALLLKSIILCKDVRELEEIVLLQPKVNKSDIADIKKKILATDTRIKEQMAIQKRSKDTLELREDLKNKLILTCEKFMEKVLPTLNHILKVIRMAPLELGSMENSEDFLEQIMDIERTIEVAEQVLTAAENNNDSETCETSDDEIENEVFDSCNTSNSEDDEVTVIPAGQGVSGSQKPVSDEETSGQDADDEEQEEERPSTRTLRSRKK